MQTPVRNAATNHEWQSPRGPRAERSQTDACQRMLQSWSTYTIQYVHRISSINTGDKQGWEMKGRTSRMRERQQTLLYASIAYIFRRNEKDVVKPFVKKEIANIDATYFI